WNQNKVALTAQNISNIQQDSRLPVAIALFNRETMECDRFHVSTLPMTCIVQSFACDFRVQKTCIVFLFDFSLVGSQQKTVGVFEINKLLQKIEEQHVDLVAREVDFPSLTRLDCVEVIYHHIHRRVSRSYEQFRQVPSGRFKRDISSTDFFQKFI